MQDRLLRLVAQETLDAGRIYRGFSKSMVADGQSKKQQPEKKETDQMHSDIRRAAGP